MPDDLQEQLRHLLTCRLHQICQDPVSDEELAWAVRELVAQRAYILAKKLAQPAESEGSNGV